MVTNEEIRGNVKKNILRYVETCGKPIGRIVDDLEISRTTLNNYINGKFVPTLYIAYRFMQYFGISFEELIGALNANEENTRLEIGIPKRTFWDFANLPYEKKKLVVDMINVLSKKG